MHYEIVKILKIDALPLQQLMTVTVCSS